jgi:hypothetical protein
MLQRAFFSCIAAVGLIFVVNCGGTATMGRNPNAPITTLSPPPGPFNDTVTVTFTTDKPATIFVTTDRTDPHVASLSRITGPSPLKLEIKRTTTVTYFARTAAGDEEEVKTGEYIRAGGKKGQITGVIVTGDLVSKAHISLQNNGQEEQSFSPPGKPTEIPFVLTGLKTGSYRLRAAADMNDDGQYFPVLDAFSDAETINLDLSDPYKASVENVKLYLGASAPGLCTIEGTVHVDAPQFGQFVSVIPFNPAMLQNVGQQGGGDPQQLLQMLRSGAQIFINPDQKDYPYAITNLACGTYIPVPLLSTLSLTNPQLNFLVNFLKTLKLNPGDVAKENFTFGATTVSGTITLKPQTTPSGFVYGIVAVKNLSLTGGLQAVLTPAIFREGATPNELGGNYGAMGLKNAGAFDVRVFTSIDGTSTTPLPIPGGGGLPDLGNAVGPLLDALIWVMNPLSQEPAMATFSASGKDEVVDFSVQLP